MSELGIGDEKFGPDDADTVAEEIELLNSGVDDENKPKGDLGSMEGLPVVVIKGFEDKVGGKSELLDVVAQWATSLVDNKVSKRYALDSLPQIASSFRSHMLLCLATTEKTRNSLRKVSESLTCCLQETYSGL